MISESLGIDSLLIQERNLHMFNVYPLYILLFSIPDLGQWSHGSHLHEDPYADEMSKIIKTQVNRRFKQRIFIFATIVRFKTSQSCKMHFSLNLIFQILILKRSFYEVVSIFFIKD
jgi:hypothetical protein